MTERFRVLGLPEVNAVRPPAKIPTIRSTAELSQGRPGPGALSRCFFCSEVGESSFNVASRKFSNLGPVEFHSSPVMCLGVPGGRHDIRSLWGLYKMHETLWLCLVSGLNVSDGSLGAL